MNRDRHSRRMWRQLPPPLRQGWGTGVSLPAPSTASQLWDRCEQPPSLPGVSSASAHTRPTGTQEKQALRRKGLEGLPSSSTLTCTPTPLGPCHWVALPVPQQPKCVTHFQAACLKEPTNNTSNFRPRKFPTGSQIIGISIMDMCHTDFFYSLLSNM